MRFKVWLENLAGPGGGPDWTPMDLVALNKDIAKHGAGAFPQGGDNPPKSPKTATDPYCDPRFARKYMRADNKKGRPKVSLLLRKKPHEA